jgi:hypothetical protein
MHKLVGSFFNRNAVTDLRPLQLLVSVRFQILFHRPPGLLFSFPSLYLFTIGQEEYLALPHRRGCFPQDFTSPVVLWIMDTDGQEIFRLPDYHRLWFHFPVDSTRFLRSSSQPLGAALSRPQHFLCVSPSSSPSPAVKLASNSV